MLKKKALIIGRGKWGRKVIKILKKNSNIIGIFDSKTFSYKFNFNNADWAFVLTPFNKHYKIVEFLLKKKINVFCEKPLDIDLKKFKYLINTAKKNKTKIYIDDIELYKKKNLFIKKKNFVKRYKFDIKKKEPILYRLTYHDIYLLKKYLLKLKYSKIKILYSSKKELNFQIGNSYKVFNFDYKTNSFKKEHTINRVNFLNFIGNPLEKMILKILYNGSKNLYLQNNIDAEFCIKLLAQISKKVTAFKL